MANLSNSWIRSWLPKTSPHFELQNQFISNYTLPSAQSFPRIHGGWPWFTQLAAVFCEKNPEDHPGNHHGAQSQLRFGTPAFRSGIGTACSPAHQGNLPGESSGVAPGRAWGIWKKMQKGHLQVRYEICWMDPNHESSCFFKVTVQQLQHAKKYSDLGHYRAVPWHAFKASLPFASLRPQWPKQRFVAVHAAFGQAITGFLGTLLPRPSHAFTWFPDATNIIKKNDMVIRILVTFWGHLWSHLCHYSRCHFVSCSGMLRPIEAPSATKTSNSFGECCCACFGTCP